MAQLSFVLQVDNSELLCLQNVRISFEALRSFSFAQLFTTEFVPVIREMQRKKTSSKEIQLASIC